METLNHIKETVPEKTTKNQLEILKEKELKQSNGIMELENEHKNFAQKHRSCIKKLREIDAFLKELRKNFDAKSQEYREIVAENNQYVQKMNEISAIRYKKVVALEEVRSQIEELESTTIQILKSGEIVIIEGPTIDIDDTGFENLYNSLLEKEECEDLKVKSIKTLARMLKILANAKTKNNEAKINVVFEDIDLNPIFKTLIA